MYEYALMHIMMHVYASVYSIHKLIITIIIYYMNIYWNNPDFQWIASSCVLRLQLPLHWWDWVWYRHAKRAYNRNFLLNIALFGASKNIIVFFLRSKQLILRTSELYTLYICYPCATFGIVLCLCTSSQSFVFILFVSESSHSTKS